MHKLSITVLYTNVMSLIMRQFYSIRTPMSAQHPLDMELSVTMKG